MAGNMEMVQNDQELRNKLLQMKEDSILTDIMISCGKITFSAHKCILSASSLFFKLIFADDISKPQPRFEFDQLNMDQILVEGKVLESVVDFMYCGSININVKNFKDIVVLADYLVMQDLCGMTLKFLQKKLNKDNCLQFYLPLCSYELRLSLSKEILMMMWHCVESFFFDHLLLQEEMLEVSAENLILILSKGIQKNFNLTNVLAFVHNWIEIRQHQEDFEVAEHFINLCIELQPRSSLERENAQTVDESIPVLQNLITTINERQNGVQDSTVIENIRFKLKQLDNQIRGHCSSDALDETVIRSTEIDRDFSGLDRDLGKDCRKHGRDNRDMDFISNSDTTEQNILSKVSENQDEVHDWTTTLPQEKFEGSSSLEKFKERALEESVQERVAIFLQGQIAYTQVTPKITFGKSKVTKIKTKLKSKDNRIKKRSDDTEFGNVVKRLNSETKGLVSVAQSDIKYNLESSLADTEVDEQKPWNEKTKATKKQSEKQFCRSPAKRRKIMKTFQDFVTNLENMNGTVDRDTEIEPQRSEGTFSHIGDGTSNDYVSREQKDFDGKGNVEIHISDLRKKSNYRNEKEKPGVNYVDHVIKEDKNTVWKKKDKTQPKLGISGEDNPGFLNISDKYRDLLLQKNIPDTCVLCKNQFTRGNHLVRHLYQVHKDVKTLNCGKCGEQFEDAKLFVAHSRTHFTEVEEKLVEEITDSDEIEYMCKVCSKQFTKISSIKAHIGHHKAVVSKTYKEETEIYKSPNDSKDDNNVKVPTIYPCNLCDATFKRRDHLQRHVFCLHSDVNPYSCDICQKTFKLRYLFTKHMVTHSSERPPEKSILCDICGATFTDQACMRRHVKRHTEKRHKCPICNKTYSQSVTLQVHMRKHSGVKPFQCEICSMLFAVKSNLLRHQRRHRGEKRYECDKCGKGFLMAGDLKRHYTTHTGEKNYACKYCGKRFNCRSKVPQHERIHTGEKPYSCRICGKSFIQSGDRKRHEATHHGKQGEGNKRRLTLYEIANPDERVEFENTGGEQNRIDSNDQKIAKNNIQQAQKSSEMDKKFKSETYDLDGAVNSIIDYAIKNKEETFSRGQFSMDKPGNSFQDTSSQTNKNEAFIPGSDMFAIMKSRQNSSDFIVQPKSKVADQELKVVVVQNTPPSLIYESIEVPNQAFYLPKEQN